MDFGDATVTTLDQFALVKQELSNDQYIFLVQKQTYLFLSRFFAHIDREKSSLDLEHQYPSKPTETCVYLDIVLTALPGEIGEYLLRENNSTTKLW